MPDPRQAPALIDLHETAARWVAAFSSVRDEAPGAGDALGAVLASAAGTDLHDDAHELFLQVVTVGDAAVEAVRALERQVELLRKEWIVLHRYTEEGLDELLETLAANLEADPPSGAQLWLKEILDAADDGEIDAAARIGTADLPWPEQLRAGVHLLGEAFSSWRENRRCPTAGPVEQLADGRLEGWWPLLSLPELRSRVHRLAAWVAVRARGDHQAGRRHIDEAVRLFPYSGRMHAERATFHLFVGDFARAALDAQHAIATMPSEPLGHLALGAWAELTGKFSGADDLYRRGLALMPTVAIRRIPQRTALIDPTGRLLKEAAERLLDRGHPEQALALVDEALLSGIRGNEAHPEASAYAVRSRALELLPEPAVAQAAEAAMEAGRMCIWNGDMDCAIKELSRAIALDTSVEAGWLLADAFVSKSFPLGAAVPDHSMVAEARSLWEEWAEKVGPPSGAVSWAYLTRAIIADLHSQRTEADRRAGVFEAVMFVEKALVHDDTDAQRWGYAAQFLRYAGLEQLAFEAAERGYALAATDRQVLAERLPLLANRRQFDEAEVVAERLVTMFGEDPWVSAVRAWLALHNGHRFDEALKLLELPLAEGSDHAWYRQMEALAYLGQGEVGQARDAYQRLLDAPPLDGNTKCRLALASVALGERGAGEQFLADAGSDPTTPRSSYVMTRAIAALAADELELALHLLEEAIRLARSAVEIDDVLYETLLTLRALGRPDEWAVETQEVLRQAVAAAVERQVESLAENPPTPDNELEAALTQLQPERPLDVERTALLALAARRHTAAGRVAEAVSAYQTLRGSTFEPEAKIALDRIGELAGANEAPAPRVGGA